MAEIDVNVTVGGVMPVTVPLTSATTDIFQGGGILCGWSLRDVQADVPLATNGNVAAPGAGAVIAQLTNVTAGTYTVNWVVGLVGPAAAADANNFQLKNGAGVVIGSINPPAVGEFPQDQVEITVAAGATVSIVAIGAGTAGVTYSAQLDLSPTFEPETTIELSSGNDTLGVQSFGTLKSWTAWFGPSGPVIQQKVTLTIVTGAAKGCIYVIPSSGS